MEAAVIGDTVNVASRLEEMTKYLGASLLISADTHALIAKKEKYLLRYLGPLELRGKITHIPIWEVYNTQPPESRENKQRVKDKFLQAVLSLQEGDRNKAQTLFQDCQIQDPDDRVTEFFLDKCVD